MNPPPIPITTRLRRAQSQSDATLYLLHCIGRVELYRRERPRRVPDYAVVRGNITAHGATPAEALALVRAELAERHANLHRPLRLRDGLELGFSSTCLLHFCRAYGLEPAGTTTPSELRRLVAGSPASEERQAHVRHLRRLGIHLKEK